MESSSIPSQVHLTTTPLNSPAPCLRRSVAELVADAESFFSSMGSRRHGMVTGAPCLETYPLPAGCEDRCNALTSVRNDQLAGQGQGRDGVLVYQR